MNKFPFYLKTSNMANKQFFSILLLLCTFSAMAQSPQAFNYQSVVRDAQGNPLGNQTLNFEVSIVQNNVVVYGETQSKTTNQFGLVDIKVGQGTAFQNSFAGINWGNGAAVIRVKVNGVALPESPILSVPYALYALKSGGSAADSWTNSGTNVFRASGNVGVGVQNPVAKLDVDGTVRSKGLHNQGSDFALGTNDGRSVGNIPHQRALVHDQNDVLKINYAGDFEGGTIIEGPKLTTSNLEVNGYIKAIAPLTIDLSGYSGPGGRDAINIVASGDNNAGVLLTNKPAFYFFSTTEQRSAQIQCGSVYTNREVSASVIEVRGADIVEKFKSKEAIEAGTLVTIDENDIHNYKTSQKAYQKGIVGIVSGANGVKHGMLLEQDDALAGNTKVAIAGRVYVKATAQNGAIKAGDMLTSSDKAGFAMKATSQRKAFGAVVGKALTSLESGEGFVLVLVGLQ